ncbi:RNase H-like domain-containing protein, partial [Klebsiella pneumoniae]
EAPILILSDYSKSFVVYTDASLVGLGYVSMQDTNAIAYGSRQLKPNERNYPVHDIKLAAVIFTLKQ